MSAQLFPARAQLARPRLKTAAIGAVDGALVARRFANGRAYAQSSTLAGGCEGHGPLDPAPQLTDETVRLYYRYKALHGR